jgi:hypothetical protein
MIVVKLVEKKNRARRVLDQDFQLKDYISNSCLKCPIHLIKDIKDTNAIAMRPSQTQLLPQTTQVIPDKLSKFGSYQLPTNIFQI